MSSLLPIHRLTEYDGLSIPNESHAQVQQVKLPIGLTNIALSADLTMKKVRSRPAP